MLCLRAQHVYTQSGRVVPALFDGFVIVRHVAVQLWLRKVLLQPFCQLNSAYIWSLDTGMLHCRA
jgi:hypothetical protein